MDICYDIYFSFQNGEMLNIFRALSYRPDELRAFISYYEAVMVNRGNVTMIQKSTSRRNIAHNSNASRCSYEVFTFKIAYDHVAQEPCSKKGILILWSLSCGGSNVKPLLSQK